MRFRHKDIAPVIAWLHNQPCIIQRLEWEREPRAGGFAFLPQSIKRRAAHQPVTVGPREVEYFAGRGADATHASLVLAHYFHINSAMRPRPLSLEEAVVFVEEEGTENEFLLAGHPDGGLVSVSRTRLPFQAGLEPITWWGP